MYLRRTLVRVSLFAVSTRGQLRAIRHSTVLSLKDVACSFNTLFAFSSSFELLRLTWRLICHLFRLMMGHRSSDELASSPLSALDAHLPVRSHLWMSCCMNICCLDVVASRLQLPGSGAGPQASFHNGDQGSNS